MADFDEFFNTLKIKLEELIKKDWKNIIKEAEKDLNPFLNETKEDLRRWTKLLTEKKLTKDEFKFLIESKKDLLKLASLKQLGLAKVKMQMFQTSIIGLITESAISTFL